jgi:hypothetical protein
MSQLGCMCCYNSQIFWICGRVSVIGCGTESYSQKVKSIPPILGNAYENIEIVSTQLNTFTTPILQSTRSLVSAHIRDIVLLVKHFLMTT